MAEPALPTAPFRDAPGGKAALLVIDLVSDFDFGRAEAMLPEIERAADAARRLRDAADEAGVPTIYINDNFGEWHGQRDRILDRAIAEGSRGRAIAERIGPREQDYFVVKPQFSGFYATNLPVLLPKLGVSRLVLTGIAADICVLFTAADAHMRDYALWVPEDGVAAHADDRKQWALEIMRHSLGAETRASTELALAEWVAADDRPAATRAG